MAAALSAVAVRAWPPEPQGETLPIDEGGDRGPRVQPANNGPYFAGPRIIHVPQPGEDDETGVHPAGAAASDDDAVDPPRREIAPRRGPARTEVPSHKPYHAIAPASADRRAVLKAPINDGPTPIRPLPRFAGEKFMPPPGYSPPASGPPTPEPAPPDAPPQSAPQPEAAPASNLHQRQ